MKRLYTLFFALLFFTMTSSAQAPPLSANEILKEATERAAAANKKVFIIFHASWCGWCHRMDSIMNNAACKKLFDTHFVVRHMVVMESAKNKQLENPGGMELLTKYQGKDKGIPFWLIFDAKGSLVADCMMRPDHVGLDQPGENTGCPATKEEVAHFVKVLKQTTSLNSDQLSVIEKNFIKK
jgi:thioredoxin-related protein